MFFSLLALLHFLLLLLLEKACFGFREFQIRSGRGVDTELITLQRFNKKYTVVLRLNRPFLCGPGLHQAVRDLHPNLEFPEKLKLALWLAGFVDLLPDIFAGLYKLANEPCSPVVRHVIVYSIIKRRYKPKLLLCDGRLATGMTK